MDNTGGIMTDSYVENILLEHFKKLEGLLINEDDLGNKLYPEVAFPNEAFERPEDGYWYELYFIPSKPLDLVVVSSVEHRRWLGIMQVNICVPKNSGIKPLQDRFDNIANLYRVGLMIGKVRITNVSKTSALEDGDYYVLPVSITWQADLEK